VRPGVLDVGTLVARMSVAPARLLNLPGGSLAIGTPADITLLDLPTLVTRLSTGPARLLNLPGGSLASGAAADITILDLDRAWTVDPAAFRSRGRSTPFAGFTGVGAPWMTLVGGQKVGP